MLETISLAEVIPTLSSQDLGRGFEHILVQYGDPISRGGPKFWEIRDSSSQEHRFLHQLGQRVYRYVLESLLLAYFDKTRDFCESFCPGGETIVEKIGGGECYSNSTDFSFIK